MHTRYLKQLVGAVRHSERACRHAGIRLGMADIIDYRLVTTGVSHSREHCETGGRIRRRQVAAVDRVPHLIATADHGANAAGSIQRVRRALFTAG